MIPTQKTLSMKQKYRVFPEREDVILLSFEHRNGAWPQKNSACLGIGAGASTSQKSRSAAEDFSQMARHMPCLPLLWKGQFGAPLALLAKFALRKNFLNL
jgi:hypothetical protein